MDPQPAPRRCRLPGVRVDLPTVVRGPAGRIPWGFVGMIGMIVAIEGLVARDWLELTDPVSLSWRLSAMAAGTEAHGRDVLCLGDSLAKHGLIPSVIERASGFRSLNLAPARSPTLMTYFLLRRALEAGAHPRAVIINAKPAVLIGGPDYNLRYWQEVVSMREGMELGRITGRVPLLAATLLGRFLPSLRSRLEIRSHLLAALRGETDRLHDINRILVRNWTVNDGANVASRNTRYQGELPGDVERTLYPDVFHVNRANLVGLERLLDLAAGRDLRVFWLLPPLSPALQARRDGSGAEAKYEQFVRSLQARHPRNLTILDARRAAYSPAMFVDATHLDGRGAVALSQAVGASLRTELTRPHAADSPDWIVLGDPGPESSPLEDLDLEDLDQSRKILELDGEGGRSVR